MTDNNPQTETASRKLTNTPPVKVGDAITWEEFLNLPAYSVAQEKLIAGEAAVRVDEPGYAYVTGQRELCGRDYYPADAQLTLLAIGAGGPHD